MALRKILINGNCFEINTDKTDIKVKFNGGEISFLGVTETKYIIIILYILMQQARRMQKIFLLLR